MPVRKFDRSFASEEVLNKVAKFDRLGYTQFAIAAQIGVTQPVVSEYLKKIRKRYSESTLMTRDALVQEKLAQYADLRREAYDAWQRSQQSLMEKGERGALSLSSVDHLLKVGKVDFLHIIADTYAAERQMLGLDEALKIDTTTDVFNWDLLAGVLTKPVEDPLEEALNRLPPPEDPTHRIPPTPVVVSEPKLKVRFANAKRVNGSEGGEQPRSNGTTGQH